MPITTHHTPGALDLDIRVQAGRVDIETADTTETTVEIEPLGITFEADTLAVR